MTRNPLSFWSGRPDSNRRRPAWEAGILPLNYGRPARSILLLERHGERLDDLVAPRFPVDPLADSVQIELLVERHRGRLLDPELVDPVVLLEALPVVHDRLRLVHHPVELLVVPVHEDAGRLEQRSEEHTSELTATSRMPSSA